MVQPTIGKREFESITVPLIFPVVPDNKGAHIIRYNKSLNIYNYDMIILTSDIMSITLIIPSPFKSPEQKFISVSFKI